MKKIYIFSLLALTGVFALSSCGDDTKTDDPSGDNSGSSESNPSGGSSGSSTQSADDVKVYAAQNDTEPIFLMTYTSNSKLDSFVYMDGSEPNFCKLVYNNNVPEKVKVCSFNSFLGVSTDIVTLNGNNPIYFKNISNYSYYPAPAYSYAEYKDNAINVKEAGLDLYKIKLDGTVESTDFKKVDSTGLKTGRYNNKFENNMLISESLEGKAEITYDGSKVINKSYSAKGSKFLEYTNLSYEVTDTFAETKVSEWNENYNKVIDYSSMRATIDSNYKTTTIATTINVSQTNWGEFILENPTTETVNITTVEDNKIQMPYNQFGTDGNATITYDSGKIKKIQIVGQDSITADFDYKNNNEIEVALAGEMKGKHEYKYNDIGQPTSIIAYNDDLSLERSIVSEYNANRIITKMTEATSETSKEYVYTYNADFTVATANITYTKGSKVEYSKMISTYANPITVISYNIVGSQEIKTSEQSRGYVGLTQTQSNKDYNSEGQQTSTYLYKRYYNDSLYPYKSEEWYSDTERARILEYTYDNTGKVITSKVSSDMETVYSVAAYTYEGNILKSVSYTTYYDDVSQNRRTIYTYSDNYETENTTQYKWDTGANDFIPANLS
ncbi:MAG: hypothetical protein IJP63_08725 [Acholeplasmatales bacterium]|nr:hypothetical protein [Acholeplasmatales bacterium]